MSAVKANVMDGKRWAYTSIRQGEESIIAICGEGEAGYRPVADYGPYKDEDHAYGVANRLNKRMGVSHEEATQIVWSTMPKPRKRPRQNART